MKKEEHILGMSASETSFFEIAAEIVERLDRVIALLEKQGSIRAG